MHKTLVNIKYSVLVFGFLLAVSISLLSGRLLITGSAVGGDSVYYYAALRSIVIDKDLDFQNEYNYFHNQTSNFTRNRKISVIPEKNLLTQKLPAKYPIGTAVLLTPSFLLAHGLIIVLQKFGFNITSDGYNIFYQLVASLTSLLYAFVGLLLIYNLGKKIFSAKIALLGTLSIWLATPLVYYMTMEPLNSQSLSFFCVSLFIYYWFMTRTSRTTYQWIILGLIGGFISIVRFQDSLFLLIPVIDSLRKFSFQVIIFLSSAALVSTIQLGVNNYLYGSFFYSIYSSSLHTAIGKAAFPYLTSPKIFYSLLSAERGLLVWSPILIFAFTGLYWFAKKTRLVGCLLIFSFLAQLYVVSSWGDPTQGDSFGNRILINSGLIFALGIMQFLKNMFTYLKLFLVIFGLLILLNGALFISFVFRIVGQPY